MLIGGMVRSVYHFDFVGSDSEILRFFTVDISLSSGKLPANDPR